MEGRKLIAGNVVRERRAVISSLNSGMSEQAILYGIKSSSWISALLMNLYSEYNLIFSITQDSYRLRFKIFLPQALWRYVELFYLVLKALNCSAFWSLSRYLCLFSSLPCLQTCGLLFSLLSACLHGIVSPPSSSLLLLIIYEFGNQIARSLRIESK